MAHPDYASMSQAVVDGDPELAQTLAQQAVESQQDILRVIDEGFARGIARVGELWDEGEYFLPELIQGAEAMKAAMAVLRPALAGSGSLGTGPGGQVVIGTVQGDVHDIGKSLVATLLAANGFTVHDLGTGVAVQDFIDRAQAVGADIIGSSALLTTTMGAQRQLAEAVRAAAWTKVPHLLVGGAPTSPEWAHEIGATHSENALAAVAEAQRLLR
jgi:methanogenic corrinoid protein MtbC1